MTKRSLLLWCAGLLFLASFSAPELRAQYAPPPDTYSVTQINSMFGAPVTMNVIRDGSRAVIENSYDKQPGGTSGGHTRTLYDLQQKTSITWDLLNPSTPCGKSSWGGDWGDPFATSKELTSDLAKDIASKVAKNMGPATINGIATKLWVTDAQGNTAKIWIEQKYGMVIKLDITDKDGTTKTFIETKQMSFAKPPASTFTLPAVCADAANAPRIPTEAERIAAETGESADNFISMTQGGGVSPNSCTVVLKVIQAGTPVPITQAAIDPDLDVNNPPHYTFGKGDDGHLTFAGGHIHEITSQLHNGVLRIENAPRIFELVLAFGKTGDATALLYRHCVTPQTALLYMYNGPDNVGDWLWVKSGKYAK